MSIATQSRLKINKSRQGRHITISIKHDFFVESRWDSLIVFDHPRGAKKLAPRALLLNAFGVFFER
mgnify:CR=1 FL=1